jgi:(2Fe-2S) ferredoxin
MSERAPNELVGEHTAATPEITGHIFERHVFVCTGGDWCAAVDGDGLGVHARLKKLVKEEPSLNGRVRVNHSGCLDQCGHGPMLVVYPENVWYWGVLPEDVEELVRVHLVGGEPVERLRYRNRPGKNKLLRDEQRRPIGRPAREERTGQVACAREPSPTER